MKSIDRLAQVISIEMRVDLRGGNGCMAKHLLHCTKIGATFDEVGGKGMSKAVWRYRLGDTGIGGGVFDDVEDHDAR